ncbi:hypothetical protein GCM10022225_58990 [Plantactinospora mayteni]|uniref:DUF1772 domain-containing protein n=1 Tax=Plantactinospora mayteni TaxID=566021 RepID=A0ABQ4EKL9_9ACTN|nr:hypothetical protein [Plantactinospora mayteni]GIG95250.1 hypothetical protein Pma05_18230 [Plantactinospora mayteni]
MNTLAAVMQLLVAVAFVSIPVVRHRFGPVAKAAAEAELRRQNVRPEVLAENKIRFDASGHETAAPVTVAAVMTATAALNLVGADLAQLLTWIFSSLVVLMNVAIIYSNLTAVKSVQAAFRRKGDPELTRVEVAPFLRAAEGAFPRWVRVQTYLRNTVVFGGSAVALVAVSLA